MNFKIARYLVLIGCLCCVVPARAAMDNEPLSGEAYTLAERAYQAIALHDDDTAEQLVVKAREVRPDSYQLAMLLLDIQIRRGAWEAAKKLADASLQERPHDALLLANSGFIAQSQKRYDVARGYFDAALQYPGLNDNQRLNVRAALDSLPADKVLVPSVPVVVSSQSLLDDAYRWLREHDDAQAFAAFQTVFSTRPGTPAQYADAAYAAKRLGRNSQVVELLQLALDGNDALPADQRAFDAQRTFSYRREIQQINRSFGVVASLAYQNNTLTKASQMNTLQGSVEAYWQPSDFAGNHDGHIFQLFAGVVETLYDAQAFGRVGSATAQGTIGTRYKPIADLGMMLTAEQRFALGSASSSDTLLRAAYSNELGTELNVHDMDWRSWQFYTEAAYFVRARRSIESFEGSYGQAFHLADVSDRYVIYPHAVLAAEYDSAAHIKGALSAGPGVKLRYWFREDRYNAPASWLDLTLQYRFEITHTNRARGVVARATLWY